MKINLYLTGMMWNVKAVSVLSASHQRLYLTALMDWVTEMVSFTCQMEREGLSHTERGDQS